MIATCHDCGVPVHAHFEVRQLCNVYVYGCVRAVSYVSLLAVGTTVFDRNDEVFGQQRRKNTDIAMFVGFCPFLFEGENLFRILGFLLSCREHGKDA